MDVIQLRRLTRLSALDFGKHYGSRVDFLMEEDKSYLVWLYYCSQRITFVDDVLDELGIPPEYRIAKPGVDKDMMYKLRTQKREEYINSAETDEDKLKRRFGIASHVRSVNRRRHIRNLIATERMIERANGKGRLAWKNQGH